MKNRFFIVSFFALLILFISCNQKTEVQYYNTGEVYKIKKSINEHESEVCFYFKNGQIEQEGMTYDSLKNGQWRTYYSDGVLRGDIIYSKNKFLKENITHPITLDFKDNYSEFQIGHSYQFRVLGVSFYSIEVPMKLGYRRIPNEENNNLYLFEITPKTAGNDTVLVIINYFKENIKNDSVFFPIKVIDGGSVPNGTF